jgi:putative membrane protein
MTRSIRLIVAAAAVAMAIALTMITRGSLASYTGYEDAAQRVLFSDWWTLWAVPPVEIALIALLAANVAVAVRARPEADRPSAWRYLAAAMAVLLLAVASPVAGLAQGGLFGAHMMQHVLIGALAPLLVLLALPRAMPDIPRPRALRAVLNPAVAFALWLASTLIWLLPPVHHQVFDHQAAWIGQQVSFFVFGIVLWAPITERLVASPRWFGLGFKCAYMVGVWFVGLTVANVFWFSSKAFYSSHAAGAAAWGLSPLQDQANGATVMVATHCLLSFGAIAVLFFRQSREGDLEQRLIEAGLDPERARDAVRYGDAPALARELGISARARPGID